MGKFTKKVILSSKDKKKEIDLLIDTGADTSIINEDLANELKLIKINTIGKGDITVIGIEVNGCKGHYIATIKKDAENIMGANVLQQLDAEVDMKNKDITIRRCEPYRA